MEISKEEMRDLFSEFFGGSAKPGAPGAGAGKRDFKDMDEKPLKKKKMRLKSGTCVSNVEH